MKKRFFGRGKDTENRDTEKKYPVGRIGFLLENMRGRKIMFAFAMLGSAVYNILQITVPYFTGQLTDTFLNPDAPHPLSDPSNLSLFWHMIMMMILITLFRVLTVYITCQAYERCSQYALYNIRNTLYDKIQRQDMTFYATFRTGDLMTRLTGDLNSVRHMVAWVIRSIIECVFLFTAVTVYFFMMDWRLALCVLALCPVIFAIVYRFRLRVKPMHQLLRDKFARMNTDAQENISGNRVVKAFAKEEYEKEKFDLTNTSYAATAQETDMTWLRYYPYVDSCANLLPVILLVVGGLFMISGSLTLGEYVSFSGLIWAVCNPMRQLGSILNEFQRFSAAADKVMEINYAPSSIFSPENAAVMKESAKGRLEFEHVSFRYPDGSLPVLEDITFTAEPGQTVAVMGETGCGKTSMINLIPRFFDPTSGKILLDGTDISTMRLEDLRKSIGLATQDVLLYSDTVGDNISYGNVEMKTEDVEKYAKLSAADAFINRLPEGYSTVIGERGVGLSGGQKQRISLARALAVRPAVLILDDTTSAVDMETEKEIQEGLNHLDFPCTKIIIAQRISTTRSADKILILKDGRISEMGTHEELIAKKGYYYELVRLQTGLDKELEELIRRTAPGRQAGKGVD